MCIRDSITGFQGITEGGDITTLGRGGSDATAVAIAAQINANRCDIYTDVDGIFTTDPNIVSNAKKLDSITMEEMLELAGQGAKVVQTRAVEFANKYHVPVRVLSSFNDGSGTLISLKDESMENALVSGIASQKDQVKFTLHSVGDIPGTAFKILGPISEAEVEVDVIVQNVSIDGKTDFTFTVSNEDQEIVKKILSNIKDDKNYKELIDYIFVYHKYEKHSLDFDKSKKTSFALKESERSSNIDRFERSLRKTHHFDHKSFTSFLEGYQSRINA